MRACILHPGSTETDLATLVAEVVAAAADLAAAASATQSQVPLSRCRALLDPAIRSRL
jgi:hypothetical protein